ncbi:MAG TPA: hypothetical protein EYQ21_04620 [Flavobacteriales bacterium]|nr:hypothetical protein [Flavobacteriales bacterium]
MDIFEYYGVDWLIFIFTLLQLWLLGEKKRAAWIAGGMIAVATCALGFMIGSLAIVLMNVVFLYFDIWNYVKWSDPSNLSTK